MHNKVVFALAGVFMIIAIVVPIVLFSLQAQGDLQNLIILQNPAGGETVNSTIPEIAQVQSAHQTTYIISISVAVVFILLSVLMLYYGINHMHPTHDKPHRIDPILNTD
jgi:ABC-type sulfate transport system permease component